MATSPSEAAALVDALEAAGIPTHVQNTPHRGYGMEISLHGSESLSKTILVPSDCVLEAEDVINAFLLEVKKEGVRRAFLPGEVEDLAKDSRPEPEMALARALKDVHEEEREERLSAHVADWLTDAHSEIKIAQRLAAAGLTEAQATALVARVVRERADLFERSRRKQLMVGAAMVLSGLVYIAVFVISLLIAIARGAPGKRPEAGDMATSMIWAIMVSGLGILILRRASHLKNPAAAAAFVAHDSPHEEKPA
jgi:hypothetical protein